MTFPEVEVDLMKALRQIHQSKNVENVENGHWSQNGGIPSITIQDTFLFVMKRHMSLLIFVHVGQLKCRGCTLGGACQLFCHAHSLKPSEGLQGGGGCCYTNVVWVRLNHEHWSYSNFVCHGELMNFDATPLLWHLTKSHSNLMPTLSMSSDPFDTVWQGCGQWMRRNTSKCKTFQKHDISCCHQGALWF